MAEIKTCEQYVLAKLAETEEINESLKDNIEALEKDYAEIKSKFDRLSIVLKGHSKISSFASATDDSKHNHYIHFEDVDGWRAADKDAYDTLVDILGLKEEQDASASN